MALDFASFVLRHPEFASCDSGMVSTVLADTEKELTLEAFGEQFDAAHALATAHRLALSPSAQNARLNNWTSETPYSAQLDALRFRAGISLGLIVE